MAGRAPAVGRERKGMMRKRILMTTRESAGAGEASRDLTVLVTSVVEENPEMTMAP